MKTLRGERFAKLREAGPGSSIDQRVPIPCREYPCQKYPAGSPGCKRSIWAAESSGISAGLAFAAGAIWP